ncbi:MAG: glycosyltransferase family 39 protein [Nanoarchaeota archaeon]|nr:glycosyltransferase family 39 protein [Nanoarchaeota archaeon]
MKKRNYSRNHIIIMIAAIFILYAFISLAVQDIINDSFERHFPFIQKYIIISVHSCIVLFLILLGFKAKNSLRISIKNKRLLYFFGAIFILGIATRLCFIGLSAEEWVFAPFFLNSVRTMNIFGKYFGWLGLLSFFLIFMPKTLPSIFLINALLGGLAPVVFYFLSKRLFKDDRIPVISSLLLFSSPLYLIITTTESYTAPAIFFTMTALMFLFTYFNSEDRLDFILSLFSLFLTVMMRPEYIMVLPLFLMAYLYFNKNYSEPANIYMIILLFLALVPYSTIIITLYKQRFDISSLNGVIIGRDHSMTMLVKNYFRLFTINLVPNLKIIISNQYIFLSNIFFSIIGTYYLLKKNKKAFMFAALFFLVFFLAYTAMHVEGFYASKLKYIPSMIAPILLLSSCGIYFILSRIKDRKILYLVVFIFIAIQSTQAINRLSDYASIKDNDTMFKEYKYLKNMQYVVDTDCVVIANGKYSLFEYMFNFRKDNIVIKDFVELDNVLTQMNIDDCYYFYIGNSDEEFFRSEEAYKNKEAFMIHDIDKLEDKLVTYGFEQIAEKDINNCSISLYYMKKTKNR